MMRESKCTESQHHSEDNCTAATKDYRKEHCQDGAASVGLVGAGETDTGRAVLAVMLPVIVCCGGGLILAMMVGFGAFGLPHH